MNVQSNDAVALLQIAMSTTQPNSYNTTELKELLTAASQGDLHTLQRLLRDEADIDALGTWDDGNNGNNNQEGHSKWTMLTIASYHRQISTIRFLVSKGASIDFGPEDNETALMTAAHQGHADIFKILLDNGADVSRKRFGGASLLHEAVAGVSTDSLDGKTHIIHELLDKGFPVDTADDEGHTSLHHAALIGTLPLVTLLVKRNANINAKNAWGDVPLDKAALSGHTNVVDFLLSHGAEVNSSAGGCTGLGFAASNGHGSVVTVLLDHGAKAVPQECKRPELLCAARSGDASVVHELVLRGFAHQATTAVFKAVLIDTVDVVKMLIDHGAADVSARNQKGQSLLHMAVLSKQWERSDAHGVVNPRIEVLALLLDRGADVEATDFQGQTAKGLAVAMRYTEAVELLQAVERQSDLESSQ